MKNILTVIFILSLTVGLLSAQEGFVQRTQTDLSEQRTTEGSANLRLASRSIVLLEEGFEGATFPPAGWLSIDADGDGHQWMLWNQEVYDSWDVTGVSPFGVIANNGLQSAISMSYLYGGINQSLSPNNWLITPPITLPLGVEANLEFYIWTRQANHAAERYSVMVSTTTPEMASFTSIYTQTMNNTMTQPSVRNIDLTVFAGNTIYVAFRHHGVTGQFALGLDDIKITRTEPTTDDLAALSISGPNILNIGTARAFNILVRNSGTSSASDYTVRLMSGNDVLETATGVALAPTETHTFTLSWTPTVEGNFLLTGEILWADDSNPDNDKTAPLSVDVYPVGIEVIYIGTPNSNTTANTAPFNFYYRNSLSQTIYRNTEINASGLITHIEYMFTGAGDIPSPREVKLYMTTVGTNVNSFSSTTAWIPYENFTLVFDGHFPANVTGTQKIKVELDTPFSYTGGNLVIMGYRYFDFEPISWWSQNNVYQVSNDLGTNRTIARITDDLPGIVIPGDLGTADVRNANVPNISLFFKTSGLGTLQGVVTVQTTGATLAGVTVELTGTNRRVTTNAQGYYSFDFLEPGVYSITATRVGYDDTIIDNVVINPDEPTIQNIQMSASSMINISGRVIGSNTDLPVVGATVRLTGYASFPSVSTNSEGIFTIPNVFVEQNYTMTIQALGYKEYVNNSVYITAQNPNLGDIMIFVPALPPRNVTAVNNENHAKITWQAPNIPTPGETWISHGGDSHHLAIGGEEGNAISFTPMHRFTQSQLMTLGVSGGSLTKVAFWANNTAIAPGQANFTIVVYTGGSGNPLSPGTLVRSQTVPASAVTWNAWTEITLDNPLPIPTSGELWIGYTANVLSGNVASIDTGPANDGFGNIVRWIEGSWHTLSYLNPVLNYNWLIKGMAETETGTMMISTDAFMPSDSSYRPPHASGGNRTDAFMLSDITSSPHIHGGGRGGNQNISVGDEFIRPASSILHSPFSIPNETRSLESYNIYRAKATDLSNEALWTTIATNVTTTEYDDYTWGNVSMGEFRYIVKSIFSHNNLSDPVFSNNLTKAGENTTYIGNPNSQLYINLSPFNFTWRSSIVQTIYRAEEIGIIGNITDVFYRYRSQGDIPVEKPVAIYMANISADKDFFYTNNDWVPFSEFTLVYDGMFPANLYTGDHNVYITLDEPFNYTGENLVVYTWRKYDTQGIWAYDVGFQAFESLEEVRTLYRGSDNPGLDPASPGSGFVSFEVANTRLAFNMDGLGSIEGIVSSSGSPVEGVEVGINGTSRMAFTDEQGHYLIQHIMPGNISLTASKIGYFDATIDDVQIIPDETITENITLTPVPNVTISGTVISSDLGSAIADASVKLTGYENYETTTDMQGKFTISNVFVDRTYTLTIEKTGYFVYVNDLIEVGFTDIELEAITLDERALLPRNVKAEIVGNDAVISWEEPIVGESRWFSHVQTDNITNGIGQNRPAQYIKAHRYTPQQLQALGVAGTTLKSVSFFPYQPAYVSSTEIRIYVGGFSDPLYAGTMVHSQVVTVPLSYAWIEVDLSSPVYIPAFEELWIGVLYNVTAEYPMGCDDGPMLDAYGNVFFADGVWTTLHAEAAPFTYNWAIKAMAEGATGQISFSQTTSRTDAFMLSDITSSPHIHGGGRGGDQNTPVGDEFIHPAFSIFHSPFSIPKRGGTDINEGRGIISTHDAPERINAFPTDDRERLGRTNIPPTRILEGYDIYRANIDTIDHEDTWQIIAVKTSETEYTDTTWTAAESAVYRYIVRAVFSNNNVSGIAYSNPLEKDISSLVTINIITSDSRTDAFMLSEAIVRLENQNGNPAFVYEQIATENTAVFERVRFGDYTLTVKQNGYFTYENTDISISTGQYSHTATLIAAHILLSEGFEGYDFPPQGWALIDADEDGLDWVHYNPVDIDGNPMDAAHTGIYSAASHSWIGDAIFPDNYLITPAIVLPPEVNKINLQYYIAAQDQNYVMETYSVMISVTTPLPENFISLQTETLSSAVWGERNIDLTQYAGMTVHLAWRHHDSSNYFVIKLDDIEVAYSDSTSEHEKDNIPLSTALIGNYPNPFNPSTTISFNVGKYRHSSRMTLMDVDTHIRIDIFNIRGQRVRTLVNEVYSPGSHTVEWNGTDDYGRSLSSGIYFYQMRVDSINTSVRRMLLLK